MTYKEIFDRIRAVKRGRYISITKRKDLGKGVSKISELVVRLGVNYSNMKINAGRKTGSLPWGAWVKGYEGFVIEHRGVLYLRVASSYSKHVKTSYSLNGSEISRQAAAAIVGEKALCSGKPDVYNIRFDNVIDIKGGIGHAE